MGPVVIAGFVAHAALLAQQFQSSETELEGRVLAVTGAAGTVAGLSALALLLGLLAYGGGRLRRVRRQRDHCSALCRQLLEEQDAHRQRLARRIRDGLGHKLVLLHNAAAAVPGGSASVASPAQELKRVSEWASEALEEARQIAQDLRPAELDRLPFRQAIDAMLGQFADRTGIQCMRDLDNVDQVLGSERQIRIYEFVAAALQDVLQRGRAAMVLVELKRDGNEINVQIQDDGAVIDSAGRCRLVPRASVLAGLNEKIALIGGHYEFSSEAGQGTCLRMRLPIENRRSAPRDSEHAQALSVIEPVRPPATRRIMAFLRTLFRDWFRGK